MTNITVLGAGAWAEPFGGQPGGLSVGDAEWRQPRGDMTVPQAEATK